MILASLPGVSNEELEDFCRRWKIAELYLFGSAARGEMRPDSDIDVMVAFQADESWDLWDIVNMRDELVNLTSRPVDIVEKGTIKNPYRRKSIERDLKVVYTA